MVSKACKEEFWKALEYCLVQFSGWSTEDAKKKSDHFRELCERNDMVYHNEPFDIADEWSGNHFTHEQREQYFKYLGVD